MRARLFIAASCLILAGCAARTGVSLLPGEIGEQGQRAETGAVVVLDSASEQDVRVIDQADSRTGVNGNRVSVKALPTGVLEARYGDLLNTIPRKPALFRLYFKTGSTDLVDPSLIDAVLAEIKARAGADIQIVGHTDTIDDDDTNDRISVSRADAIKTVLVARSADPAIIRTSGRGERELRVQTPNDVANAENRRVEITVR